MRVVLVGTGAVGVRSARQLLSSGAVDELVALSRRPLPAGEAAALFGGRGTVETATLSPESFASSLRHAAVALLAAPGLTGLAKAAVASGIAVVSVSESPAEVRLLLELGSGAAAQELTVVAGAGMAPGLSCLLVALAAKHMDEVSEVHVATLGTGGPACARRRHASFRELTEEWRAGGWERKVGGSGRQLVWFPGDVSADCYRVNRGDALLLVRAFPSLETVTSKAAASRRDRLTSWLPMLRPPHPEGTVGALAVEVRGKRGGRAEAALLGAKGRPALIAGAVAALAAEMAGRRELLPGAGGLASVVRAPESMLSLLVRRGIYLAAFGGAEIVPTW